MNQQSFSIKDQDAYVKEALAVVHAGNDYRIGNKAYARMMAAAKAIRLSHQDGGKRFFSSLLVHEEPYIVSVAAFHLIPLDLKLALRTLKGLTKHPDGLIAFNAEMTLKEWKSGRLDADWFMKEKH